MKTIKSNLLKVHILIDMLFFFLSSWKKIVNAEVIFFIPFYHMGGAERIHLQIVTSIKNKDTVTFFTKESSESAFKKDFKEITEVCSIFKFIRHKGIIKRLFLKLFFWLIDKNTSLKTVFGCNTEFFYDLLGKFKNNIQVIDLTHAFSFPDYGLENYSIKFIKYIDKRVVINRKTKIDFKNQYLEYQLPMYYLDRLVMIENALPKLNQTLKDRIGFEIGYLGRWAKEKRPELFIDIVIRFNKLYDDTVFKMAGFIKETVIPKNITICGILQKPLEVSNFYNDISILIITSYREGMPLVLIEAMQHGVVVISTNVGSIEEHIVDGVSGFLIDNYEDEDLIVMAIYEKLKILYADKELLNKMSIKASRYIGKKFNIDDFNASYKRLLLNE